MIVTASLIWWDESPEDLAAWVRGMANIADRVVAVDGAYARYPGATIRSPDNQVEAIRRTAEEFGMEARFVLPDRLWAGQVEKRSHALQAASQDSDWIAVADADWRIHTKRETARRRLAMLGPHIDVVKVAIHTPRARTGLFATGWHRREGGRRYYIPHLFRALPGMQVERKHWFYSALKDGHRVWLWHPANSDTYPVVRTYSLGAPYHIEHLTLHRDERHVLDSRAFLNDREKIVALTGQEDDVPGLFAPVYDYESERPHR